MKKCDGCRKPVLMVKMQSGRYMPVDPSPRSDGTIVIENGVGRVTRAPQQGTLVLEERFVTHFATCPDASRFRRKKSKR